MNKIVIFLGVLLAVVLTSGCQVVMKSLKPAPKTEIICEEWMPQKNNSTEQKNTEDNNSTAEQNNIKASKIAIKKKFK